MCQHEHTWNQRHYEKWHHHRRELAHEKPGPPVFVTIILIGQSEKQEKHLRNIENQEVIEEQRLGNAVVVIVSEEDGKEVNELQEDNWQVPNETCAEDVPIATMVVVVSRDGMEWAKQNVQCGDHHCRAPEITEGSAIKCIAQADHILRECVQAAPRYCHPQKFRMGTALRNNYWMKHIVDHRKSDHHPCDVRAVSWPIGWPIRWQIALRDDLSFDGLMRDGRFIRDTYPFVTIELL